MAISTQPFFSTPFVSSVPNLSNRNNTLFFRKNQSNSQRKTVFTTIQAVKLPAGVELPKEQPKLQSPFAGFTKTAEIWNSRACMIGLIGTFIVELIVNKGILQLIGIEIGKGLDIPL